MATAQELIDKVALGFQDKLDSLNGARDNANLAATKFDTALSAGQPTIRIFVDAINGDDASLNPNNAGAAVKTLGEALRRTKVLRINSIFLLTDVIFDEKVELSVFWSRINIVSWDAVADNYPAVNRTITFKDEASGAARAAQLILRSGHGLLWMYYVNVHLDSQYATAGLFLENMSLHWYVRNVTVSQSATNNCHVLDKTFADASALHLVASLFTPDNVDGKIVNGVGAGDAIDDVYWITSNLITL